MSERVVVELSLPIATVRLEGPARHNVLDVAGWRALADSVNELSKRDDVRCIAVRGTGGRAFSAGGDVKAMAEGSESALGFDERAASLRRRMELSRMIHEGRTPWIAAVRGPAAGASLSLALACDMRVASQTAPLLAQW